MEEKATSSPSNQSGHTKPSSFKKQIELQIDRISELSQLSVAQPEGTIYRVHGHLRHINDKGYDPEVIAIGPYHHNKKNLKMMEDHKLRYLSLICLRKNANFDKYFSVIEPLEQEARKCYANSVSLNKTKFVAMLVLDSCFIIELVRKFVENEPDLLTRMAWMMNSLQRDLMLFENQIPFFVLCKLYDLIEGQNQHGKLIGLLTTFFRDLYPGEEERERSNRSSDEDRESSNRNPNEIKHLLHLVRIRLVSSFESDLAKLMDYEGKRSGFIQSASWLKKANVKFKRNEGAHSFFDIKFENGTLHLPPLIIEDRTESLLRNLIVYEQYFQESQSSYLTDKYNCVTDYVVLFDCLINSLGDAEILSHSKIINNWLGDNEVVAKIFNKITDSVTMSEDDFIYGEIFVKLNDHCRKSWNKRLAEFRRNYCNSPWAIISLIAAAVLLLLTFLQTVFSGLSL